MSMVINPFSTVAPGGLGPPVVGTTLLYTGNGTSQGVTGASFSPDLVLVKARDATTPWRWVDIVRGAGFSLNTNTANAQSTEATGLTAFDADGFTVGADTDYNNTGVNYFAYVLQEVAGAFDIVAYAGNGSSPRNISHGLGVVPELIIVKNYETGTTNWAVYPGPLSSPETKYLTLNDSTAVATSSTRWNDTVPTSSVFTIGSTLNSNLNDFIAYVFASKAGATSIGSYTGNGTASGPVVTTGFTPRFVLFKRTSATGGWAIFDNARDATSPHSIWTQVDGTSTENTISGGGVDFLSTGFQVTGTDGATINASGATYIYLAVK